jgi:hypothetical protein
MTTFVLDPRDDTKIMNCLQMSFSFATMRTSIINVSRISYPRESLDLGHDAGANVVLETDELNGLLDQRGSLKQRDVLSNALFDPI